MKECANCEYQGYSPDLCMAHIRSCKPAKGTGKALKTVPFGVKMGAKTLVGAGIGVAVVMLGGAAASFVGGAILFKALIPKIGAGMGVAGGALGFYKSVKSGDKNYANKLLKKVGR